MQDKVFEYLKTFKISLEEFISENYGEIAIKDD